MRLFGKNTHDQRPDNSLRFLTRPLEYAAGRPGTPNVMARMMR